MIYKILELEIKVMLKYFACFSLLGFSLIAYGQNDNDFYSYDVEELLESKSIILPEISAPIANYTNAVATGQLLFLAGKGPEDEAGNYMTGKVGYDVSIEEGYAAARRVAIMQLAVLKESLGDLNRVKRIVKVNGMVNATDDFEHHPEVINGFSDLMVEVFGDRGKHARAAVGMSSLPRNIICEIEIIVEFQ